MARFNYFSLFFCAAAWARYLPSTSSPAAVDLMMASEFANGRDTYKPAIGGYVSVSPSTSHETAGDTIIQQIFFTTTIPTSARSSSAARGMASVKPALPTEFANGENPHKPIVAVCTRMSVHISSSDYH